METTTASAAPTAPQLPTPLPVLDGYIESAWGLHQFPEGFRLMLKDPGKRKDIFSVYAPFKNADVGL